MKNKYSKKMISESISRWNKRLNEMSMFSVDQISESQSLMLEDMASGLAGYAVGAAAANATKTVGPTAELMKLGAGMAGNQIGEYFYRREAADMITDAGLFLLAAAQEAGANGLPFKEFKTAIKKANVKISLRREIERLCRGGFLDSEFHFFSSNVLRITAKGKKALKDAGYDQKKMEKTSEEIVQKVENN